MSCPRCRTTGWALSCAEAEVRRLARIAVRVDTPRLISIYRGQLTTAKASLREARERFAEHELECAEAVAKV